MFDYQLPDELIAQVPAPNRSDSRLMIVNRATAEIKTGMFPELIEYIYTGDCLVVNNTKVFKARLFGNRVTGGEVEIFLVRRNESDPLLWEALAQPSKRLNESEEIYFHRQCHTEKLSLGLEKYLGDGRWQVRFNSKLSEEKIIDTYGHVPLPQYIKRQDTISDVSRYQTIFARDDLAGAVAAPTAGFHFTKDVLDRLKAKQVEIEEVTLHVGPGTFKPVTVDTVEDHTVDPEYAVMTEETAGQIDAAINRGNKIIAVGTTSTRTLESAKRVDGRIKGISGMVDLYIRPGYSFQYVDHLLTNFHLPKSSLLILVSAFAGRELILEAYQRAIAEKFRFYSYGDAMLIL